MMKALQRQTRCRTTPWLALASAGALLATAPVNLQAQAAATAVAAEGSAATAVQRPVRQSWTADRRAFSEGDVITVLVDEHTLASATTGNYASDRRRRDASVSVRQDVVLDAPRSAGAGFGSGNSAESRQSGEAVRRNNFQGEMTVRVVGIENGILRLEGRKMVDVDKNRQELRLTGWVRPQDVTTRNTVDSWRIAEAELVYLSRGGLGTPRGGIVSRLIGVFWP